MLNQSTVRPGTKLTPVRNFAGPTAGRTPRKVAFAKKMRDRPTAAEAALWRVLWNRCEGFRFRRQSVVAGYIPDFYCALAGLIIEVDGPSHEQQREYDAERTKVFRSLGIHVLRFSNQQVLEHPRAVYDEIADVLRNAQLPKPPRRSKANRRRAAGLAPRGRPAKGSGDDV